MIMRRILIFSCPSSAMPTMVTYSLFLHIGCVGFKAFRPSRPNRNLAKLMGVMHMEVDQVADMMMDMKVDKVADMVADMVMKILKTK